MPTGHVFIAASLDGFIAREDGGLDWLEAANAAGEDHGYDAFIATVDGIVMGRKTFEVSLGFEPWPYTRPLIVLSETLQPADMPPFLAGQIAIARSVPEALAEADRQGWRRAYVDGGATIRAFLAHGAVQDMVITRIPVLLGRGLPLFGALAADLPLRHIETRSFPSGLVQSCYAVAAEHASVGRI
jgi:dihydrofolate reductase